ncbi:MAG: UDP-2,3-diacylglucosamine diphosphatase LpxI [Alphaproteobacteria bacterium]|nr:UDP-2,3-diacylglucosamine diphosphatase LpxI [Alphaproteobacteria bacterium]
MTGLAIIAGGGALPKAVAQSARADGRAVFVIGLIGSLDEEEAWIKAFPHEFISPGAPGQAFKSLRRENVGEILLAGKVERPRFSELKLDAKGVLLMPRALKAARQGDDALLRFLVAMFEKEGFRAIGVAEAAPGLVCGEGNLGKLSPSEEHRADMARGFAIVKALGALDVGQAAAVCEGLALAVEAAEGTDRMITRISTLREALRGTPQQKRGVLVKALKPTQDAKTDMPVIGTATLDAVAAVGLAGIGLEAGASLIMDKEAVAARADALGLFVTGVRL